MVAIWVVGVGVEVGPGPGPGSIADVDGAASTAWSRDGCVDPGWASSSDGSGGVSVVDGVGFSTSWRDDPDSAWRACNSVLAVVELLSTSCP